MQSALAGFLFQQGCQDKSVVRHYLDGSMMFWVLSNDAVDDQNLFAAASDVLSGSIAAEVVAQRGREFDGVLGVDGAFAINDFIALA